MEIAEPLITTKLNKSLDKIKLNIGCGANKLTGFINIDSQESNAPDLVFDITKGLLPYEENSVDEILFSHCIEHIEEKYHDAVLTDFWRVLRPDGILYISYPEFLKCVEAYSTNLRGQRDFFKATIYGRQSHPGDFHVTLMDTPFFKNRLKRIGFYNVRSVAESYPNEFNTVVCALKEVQLISSREDILKREIFEA